MSRLQVLSAQGCSRESLTPTDSPFQRKVNSVQWESVPGTYCIFSGIGYYIRMYFFHSHISLIFDHFWDSGAIWTDVSQRTPTKNIVFWKIFFRSKIFSIKIFSTKKNRPHISNQKIPKIPKITLRKLCDEAWCLKTKYIIPNHEFIVNFPLCPDRKKKCFIIISL